jgi:hypothetical protein
MLTWKKAAAEVNVEKRIVKTLKDEEDSNE